MPAVLADDAVVDTQQALCYSPQNHWRDINPPSPTKGLSVKGAGNTRAVEYVVWAKLLRSQVLVTPGFLFSGSLAIPENPVSVAERTSVQRPTITPLAN